MENNEINQNEKQPDESFVPEKPKTNKGLLILLIIIVLSLGSVVAVLISKMNDQKQEYTEAQNLLEGEKQSLSKELKDLIGEYDALKSNNDSMNTEISEQQEKIKKLLAIQGSNVVLITKYKKELSTLREVLKSYIAQVDSLNTRNQQLVQENVDVKNKLETARNENLESSKKIDELSTAVEKGSIISTSNLSVELLNKRGRTENKSSKITKVKVCFTLRENKLTQAGTKDVYIRIMSPDGAVIAYSDTDVFDFEGQQIVYSAKRQIEYENADVDMCIYWDNNNQLTNATYTVDIFTDAHLIGTTTFNVKKK